ncbi:hypothetical protein PR048_028887 [Dryococelus australis]|uniref:Uncharacterized protein n=1 Tax=Dryococelus australis TaxID=614101 RepID=A0ABQ9GEJ5_9NEOP|nr:hypothetical protein PR048_028887 [Dryococelus australis]
MEQRGMKGQEKREIQKKTPTSGIPSPEDPGVTGPGVEPGSYRGPDMQTKNAESAASLVNTSRTPPAPDWKGQFPRVTKWLRHSPLNLRHLRSCQECSKYPIVTLPPRTASVERLVSSDIDLPWPATTRWRLFFKAAASEGSTRHLGGHSTPFSSYTRCHDVRSRRRERQVWCSDANTCRVRVQALCVLAVVGGQCRQLWGSPLKSTAGKIWWQEKTVPTLRVIYWRVIGSTAGGGPWPGTAGVCRHGSQDVSSAPRRRYISRSCAICRRSRLPLSAARSPPPSSRSVALLCVHAHLFAMPALSGPTWAYEHCTPLPPPSCPYASLTVPTCGLRQGCADWCTNFKNSIGIGAAVAERLACFPPIKANRTMTLVGGFSLGSSVSPAFSFRRCSILTSIILIGSQYLAVKSRPNIFTLKTTGLPNLPHPRPAAHQPIAPREAGFTDLIRRWGRGGVVVRLLVSHQGEPGSIPGGVAPGFSHVEIVLGDAAGQRVFSLTSHFPRPLHSGAAPYSPHFIVIGSRNHNFKSRPSLFTPLHETTRRFLGCVRTHSLIGCAKL